MRDGRPNPDIWGNIITCGEIAVGIYEIVDVYKRQIVKDRSTMRLIAATTDEEMLKVIIGAQILLGVMDYRGFSNMKRCV